MFSDLITCFTLFFLSPADLIFKVCHDSVRILVDLLDDEYPEERGYRGENALEVNMSQYLCYKHITVLLGIYQHHKPLFFYSYKQLRCKDH